ncbi:alcohol dehydrogenase GroES-like domain-containing protein [Colletotrichum scovillei]|uniref:Alcohol dehydrogenase GroES-like domain-containing protein n=1 Tax=Colletotrichum scovillei TaxID=1209932 RepID=A0A9P7UHY6_9PEZI|nr:alcohol dehydrogenase GroES-like domain-containing protein [Colletotrichum scovillei]KAF4781985.1 alcohol dehydrogenase GroES-like domain-containing protein [Colletotrichum scovillei]KAG7050030.1 alcohol dehydrogenase GroES-like domain-containing protein [Colletotrichum scovillei]KAG7069066.1 alcohol dehydrogenase GroES-like domain-containing protein [Colletotrichum scovillei]KAG7073020.1 alcohol dehydrogenase GroES-like domain-containing protein [Colletotrichum scovillei]
MATTEIPKTMKAIRVTSFNNPYEIQTIPVPSPTSLAPHDLLVKIAVASYCHTDSMVSSGIFATSLPCTASHEGSGTVVAVGSASTSSDFNFKVGDRVMCGLPLHPCGSCFDCTSAPETFRQYCSRIEGHVGVHVDGCFAEYVKVDARSTVPIPDAVSLLSAAPLACAGRTVWRGVVQAGLKEGQWLAILGSGGGLGHLGIQIAKALGLRVIGIDARDEGLELTRTSGADVVLDARKEKEDVVREAKDAANGGQGVDATLNLSDADSAAALACAVTKMHGTVVQIAQPDEVKIPFQELVFRDVRVKGSLLCSREESAGLMEHVAKNGIKLKTNVFHGLDKIHELVELVHTGKMSGKAVIVVDEQQMENEKKLGAKF